MIGIFDSGSGGLTVLRAIRRVVPQVDIVYFGDLANMPYGTKSAVQLGILAASGARVLREAGADIIVWACNSISAAVIRPQLERFEVSAEDVVEMVGPCVNGLLALGERGRVAILATLATTQSGIYARACEQAGIDAIAVSCPELANAIEQDDLVLTRTEIERAVVEASMRGAHTLALCCTHYPLARDVFEEVIEDVGLDMIIFDPADSVAQEVLRRVPDEGNGAIKFILSEDSPRFYAKAAVIGRALSEENV